MAMKNSWSRCTPGNSLEAASLLIFATALLITAGSPGPSVAALVSRVLAKGWQDVLPFLAAMWFGEVVWLTIAVAGLAALAETYQLAFQVLKWCGVAYLLVLAWQMWFGETEIEATDIDTRGGLRMFFAGLLVTFGNPKIMVFYVALLPTLLDMQNITVVGWMSLSLVTVLVLALIDITYVVMAQRARGFLMEPDRIKWVNRSCAGVMTSAAALIAARS